MALLLGLDLETTGLDVNQSVITEVGAVLWDTEQGVPIRMLSELVDSCELPPEEDPLWPEITAITGITHSMIKTHGLSEDEVYSRLDDLASYADAVVAHNGNLFDKPMLQANLSRAHRRRFEWPTEFRIIDGKLWIDSTIDVPFPEGMTTRKLTHLAAEHGFLNPFAHRAVFDVLSMLRIVQQYPIEEIIASAQQPNVVLHAVVSYDDREKAKSRGYRWDGASKKWHKTLKAHKVEAEQAECRAAGFSAVIVENIPGL